MLVQRREGLWRLVGLAFDGGALLSQMDWECIIYILMNPSGGLVPSLGN